MRVKHTRVCFLFIPFITVVTLSGCATQYAYLENPNGTSSYLQDRYQCNLQAQQQVSSSEGNGVGLFAHTESSTTTITNKEIYQQCLAAKGYCCVISEVPVEGAVLAGQQNDMPDVVRGNYCRQIPRC